MKKVRKTNADLLQKRSKIALIFKRFFRFSRGMRISTLGSRLVTQHHV